MPTMNHFACDREHFAESLTLLIRQEFSHLDWDNHEQARPPQRVLDWSTRSHTKAVRRNAVVCHNDDARLQEPLASCQGEWKNESSRFGTRAILWTIHDRQCFAAFVRDKRRREIIRWTRTAKLWQECKPVKPSTQRKVKWDDKLTIHCIG